MNVLSLFDGMSCGQIALNKLGIKYDNYFASEIDKHAIKVTQHNYPNTKQIGNVLDIKGQDLPKIDLLIGGSPCQSFSRSGDGSGFDGKSKLFWEFMRVFNETKPKFFLLENVVMKKEWEQIITEAIGVEPIELCSSIVSAQKRPRLYWTNITFDGINQKNQNISDIVIQKDNLKNRENIQTDLIIGETDEGLMIRNATKKGYLIANNFDSVNLDFPRSKTRRGRVGYKKTNTLNTGCNIGFVYDKKIIPFDIVEIERLQTLPDNYTNFVSVNQRKKMIGNGWTIDIIVELLKNIKND